MIITLVDKVRHRSFEVSDNYELYEFMKMHGFFIGNNEVAMCDGLPLSTNDLFSPVRNLNKYSSGKNNDRVSIAIVERYAAGMA